jgi:hypothetical protein
VAKVFDYREGSIYILRDEDCVFAVDGVEERVGGLLLVKEREEDRSFEKADC